ncbi:hypothetical protein CEXT_569641 [Caerostris extrusa]|uniref:Uncharacterized protein n=1 Tax=Caerostris extrusa TaxID=172846 RepID=A0AAV4REG8_CAEEX|nr:hypothetical protein CEXT_569641 [Caerostris extrusa]
MVRGEKKRERKRKRKEKIDMLFFPRLWFVFVFFSTDGAVLESARLNSQRKLDGKRKARIAGKGWGWEGEGQRGGKAKGVEESLKSI